MEKLPHFLARNLKAIFLAGTAQHQLREAFLARNLRATYSAGPALQQLAIPCSVVVLAALVETETFSVNQPVVKPVFLAPQVACLEVNRKMKTRKTRVMNLMVELLRKKKHQSMRQKEPQLELQESKKYRNRPISRNLRRNVAF